MSGLRAVVLLGLLLAAAAPLRAQDPVAPVLEGRVVRSGEPMSDMVVGLHRVTPSEAGQMDSVRTAAEGSFRFALPTVPGDPARESGVYFASVRHQGVLYFGQAVNQAAQLDSLYVIEVHDTVSAPPGGQTFPIVARNLLLEESEFGWTVVELFRLRNEGERTVVAPEGGIVWSHPLPERARGFQPGESDLAPDAVTFEGGAIRVSSPVPPGERTFFMQYEVPELPVTVPVTDPTERLEMRVREPAPPLTVTGMERLAPVEMELGSNYRRYAASEVEGTVVELTEGEEGGSGEVVWIAVVLSLVLAGAAVYAIQHRPRTADAGGPTRSELLVRIAELDHAFQGDDGLSRKEKERYRAERERLKARLREIDQG